MDPRFAHAIGTIESSGRYGLLGPVTSKGDRAYGKYQVMGSNVGPWSQAALGYTMSPDDFLKDPAAQDKVFEHRFGSYVDKYGNPQDAASAWFTGRPLAQGANAHDQLGTSGTEYVRRFNAALGGGAGGALTSAPPQTENSTGVTPMPTQSAPALSIQNMMGSGALAPQGFSVPNEGVGDTLQNVGAWLMAPSNPGGAASLLKSVQAKKAMQTQLATALLTKDRYTPYTDPLGYSRVLDRWTGKVVDAGSAPAEASAGGGAAPAAAPSGVAAGGVPGGPPSAGAGLLNSPVALKTTIETAAKANADKYAKLIDAGNTSKENQGLIDETLALANNPHVVQGGGAEGLYELKNFAHNWMPSALGGDKLSQGVAETGKLDKNFQQIVANNLRLLPGVRAAGPSIKFEQSASGGLDRPRDANLQILHDSTHLNTLSGQMADLARKYGPTLGPEFEREAAELVKQSPLYQGGPLMSKQNAPALPKGVNSIKLLNP